MNVSFRVFSICSPSHKDVWKLTSSMLPECIEATEFIVYVPDKDVHKFKKITDSRIKVSPQESLDSGFASRIIEECNEVGNLQRAGWYIQQFYKIEALRISDKEITGIWDADCVPTRKIQLIDKSNNPIYMRADEFNDAYFKTIKKLFGMDRVQNFSFVIPGFAMKKQWIEEIIADLQSSNSNANWFDSIIKNTDFSLQSSFSETETLGTWISNKHPEDFSWCELNWERLGQSRFNYAKNINKEEIIEIGVTNNLDIVSFENWDLRGYKAKLKALKIMLSKLLSSKKSRKL